MAWDDSWDRAIQSIESSGRHDAVGPWVTRKDGSRDRAYGLHQVMGNNIGPWSQQYLGRTLTPEQFLASPEDQKALFRAKFGEYAQQYGPAGAARAWFAGPGGMNRPGAKDPLGTSVASYENKFMNALGLSGSGHNPAQVPTPAVAPVEPTVASAFVGMPDQALLTPPAQVPLMEPEGMPGHAVDFSSFFDPAFAPRGARRRSRRA
jgi:hypothetical protein